MGPNMVFFGWGQVRAGRERMAGDLFNEYVQYLGGQQQQGTIQSFQIVFLDPHGGDLGGFFLIHGETDKLDAMLNTDEWIAYLIRAGMYLDNTGVVRGATGDLIMERMRTWTSLIPA
jgi:hypothetical protein